LDCGFASIFRRIVTRMGRKIRFPRVADLSSRSSGGGVRILEVIEDNAEGGLLKRYRDPHCYDTIHSVPHSRVQIGRIQVGGICMSID
jgi:hypothetical protein